MRRISDVFQRLFPGASKHKGIALAGNETAGGLAAGPPLREELFSAEQLAQHARALAAEHRLLVRPGRDNSLLDRLNFNDGTLRGFNQSVLVREKPGSISPATEWLVDNYYLIEEHIQLARRHFPKKYSRELPCLSGGKFAGQPRVYGIAIEFLSHVDAQMDMESLRIFLNAYQEVSVLKLGELWAVPIMLRLGLIENLQRIATQVRVNEEHRALADHWVEKFRGMSGKGRRPSQMIEAVAEMAKSEVPLTSAFVSGFCQRLSSQQSMLHIARSWLEQRLAEDGVSIDELIHAESHGQAADQVSVSHSIGSLRFLGTADWKSFVEDVSLVEHVLRGDPSGVHSQMDFQTRDNYRHMVELFARRTDLDEADVARHAVRLASEARAQGAEKQREHAGYYLVGDGRRALARAVNARVPFGVALRAATRRHPVMFYGGSIGIVTVGCVWAFAVLFAGLSSGPGATAVLWPDWVFGIILAAFAVGASQLAVAVVNWLAMQMVRPHMLPRMDFSKGIPADSRTVVVVPSMLAGAASADRLVENMELHFLANRDENLHFVLLTDFADAAREKIDGDDALAERARAGIAALNAQYAPGRAARFFLLHRPRRWNPREGVWMGYERKRGKIAEFNAVLLGARDAAARFSHIEGDASVLRGARYVITLDTDTQLPRDAARKLAAAMAHPLNRPVFDEKRNIVVRGYAILQPRVAENLTGSQRSLFARLFSGEAGVDPYTRAVSDVYQDLFHEGSFVGKGIYDVAAFERALGGRLPENRILSHDLLESSYARSALVSDVEVYEDFPPGYNVDASRRHRWMRGDWQIARWLMPRVPLAAGGRERNPLPGISQWKLLDNLRRTFVAPSLLVFLAGCYLFYPQAIWLAVGSALVIFFLPGVLSVSMSSLCKSREQTWRMHLREVWRKAGRQFAQTALSLVFLPHEARLCAGAVLKTWMRLLFTRRHLLQWKTAAAAERGARNTPAGYYASMWFAPACAAMFWACAAVVHPAMLPGAVLLLFVWAAAPWVAWRISRPIKPRAPEFSEDESRLLRRIARKTWHFFDTFVNAGENWLPPDNFQEAPAPVVAHRTSPTNIGMSLLANLAARDSGYIDTGRMIERTEAAFGTLRKMKKFREHLYNWYDTRTLEPLPPLYVSSVDSGNLAGHLLVLGEGLRELEDAPVFSPSVFDGLLDTVRVIKELPGAEELPALDQLEAALEEASVFAPATLGDAHELLAAIADGAGELAQLPGAQGGAFAEWCGALKRDCDGHLAELRRFAPWLSKGAPSSGAPALDRASLTLRELASLDETQCEAPEAAIALLLEARGHAARRMRRLGTLADACEEFSRMDFSFLYNESKKLFAIGYNVTEQRMDAGSYDLLASEARLCSYVAIAQGQAPQEHWFSLSRLLVVSQGEPVLQSWSGSMFEYLMPLLVMPNFGGALLDHTCKAAVQEQIAYGESLGVPWGISESGYNRTDALMNYQYRAFGIPSLGLKRGLSEELVIAPYATVLALMVAPREACENLRRLAEEGREGAYGFYEAVDYTPAHLRPEEKSATIASFMAHHQGMSLLSLVNVLRGNPMHRRFLACPMLKATDLLLQERISRAVTANRITDDSTAELKGVHPLRSGGADVMRVFKDTAIAPQVHLLSNGRYHVMVTNAGGGYSRWRDCAVTRWREDATRDAHGFFVYMRDTASHDATWWSAAHQPGLRSAKGYEAIFTQAYAEFRQRRPGIGIEMHTGICVSPEDDIELRRIKLVNHSHHTRVIELTSYAEVVIAPQAADEAHPAFGNLFVQTEFAPASSAVFCTRRARSGEERPPHLVHLMLVQGETRGEISCETDRARFLGRGHTPSSPLAMREPGALSNTAGPVLDPIVSLRRAVAVPPGQTVTVYFALGMAETREAAAVLADKYQNARIADRAFELAWTHSQVVLHQLNASEAEAQVFGRLASALVYSDPAFRAPPTVLKNNRRGQGSLWAHGISGDLPLVLARISTRARIGLARQLVQAHAYWRMKGLAVDLLILNEDTSVYRQSLHDDIVNLVSSSIEAPMLERPGGIFVRRIEQIPGDDLQLFHAVARIVIEDSQDALAAQLARRASAVAAGHKVPAFRPAHIPVPATEPELPPRDLFFANGLGGFTRDGREYVITLQPGRPTPAPWCNVLANELFGTVVSESGGSYTWFENAHEFRLTPWHNDPVQDPAGEALYIRDEQTGQFWSPAPLPARGATPYVVRHGFGYTVFEHCENGIASELWNYVATDAPVKFFVLKLRNVSGRPRRVSVTGCVEWVLGENRSRTLHHVQTEADLKTGALFARNHFNHNFPGLTAFFDAGEIRTVSGDRREFLGQNGHPSIPAAMRASRLSGKTGAGLDPCGALQVALDLAPGQERETIFRLGCARGADEARALVTRFRATGSARRMLENVWEYWNRTLGTINVDAPDASVNMMANGWLLYQVMSARLWGRSGFYQSGGAYGFRDQLQDTMALVHAEPALARRHLLRAASRQFREGDVQHWWHPPQGRGVRTHFSDDYLWLPYAVCRYVSSVADTGVLDEQVPFLEGRPLRPDEESYYDMPGRSDQGATLYEHCVRAIRHGLRLGAHGLPLIGCGDWNDGMNLVGRDGRGESVWLAFFLYDVLMKFSEIAAARGDGAFADECRRDARELQRSIEQHAWDGEWYKRAFFDNGEPLGSAVNEECRIDSLPQSWSVISAGGDPWRARAAMEQVDRQLVRRDEKLIRLFTPPFDKSALNPGYIKGYIPGVRENGGQYTHGAIWTAMAFALLGDTARAWELFGLLNPIRHASSPEEIATYKVEPYVVAADVYGAPPHTGRGGWTWYTGSAAWMYRLLVETLLGVTRSGAILRLTPRPPQAWRSYKVHYRYFQTVFHITIARIDDGSAPRLVLDGTEQPEPDRFVMTDDHCEHLVDMWIV